MDSRRFGVFLVAIFLFASFQVPAIAQTTTNASASTTIVEPSSTVGISPAITVTESAKPPVETSKPLETTSLKPPAEMARTHESTSSVTTTQGPVASAVNAVSAPAASANVPAKAPESETVQPEVSTKSESAALTTTLPTPINSQSIRDVAVETCSSGFQALQKESLIPEKVILSVAGGMTAVQFCNQTTVIEKLKTTCANMKADVEGVEGAKAAPIAAGLAAMFSAVCSNVAENLPVVAGSGVGCNEALMQTTKKCTAPMKSTYSYPTEMLYHEMMNSSCTMLDEFKNCVSKGMEAICSSAQQQAVSKIMAAVMKDHQCSSATTVPTTKAPEPAPEPAPTTKAAPVLPSQPKNSGTYFQLNIFTLLPILLSLAFKFY